MKWQSLNKSSQRNRSKVTRQRGTSGQATSRWREPIGWLVDTMGTRYREQVETKTQWYQHDMTSKKGTQGNKNIPQPKNVNKNFDTWNRKWANLVQSSHLRPPTRTNSEVDAPSEGPPWDGLIHPGIKNKNISIYWNVNSVTGRQNKSLCKALRAFWDSEQDTFVAHKSAKQEVTAKPVKVANAATKERQ